MNPNSFEFVGHVDPPPDECSTCALPGPRFDHEHDFNRPGLFHYIGPRLFPVGIYMPKGYDIEGRPGDDEGWTVLRARCLSTGQVMTQWAVGPMDDAGMANGIDLMEEA